MRVTSIVTALVIASCAVPSTRGGVGTQCDKNSDCAAPLVCRIGYCRVECRTSEDCRAPAACVLDENRRGACQLPAELSCNLATDCTAPLVCRFNQCTNECNADRDCAPGSTCRTPPDDPGGPRGCVYDVRASCALDGVCPGDLVCGRDGQCREECRTDRDCRNNRFCAVRGRCDERVTVCRDPDNDGIRSCLFECTPDCDAVPDDTRPYVCSPLDDPESLERACRPTCTAADECGPRGWRCDTHGGPTGECVPEIPDPLFTDGGAQPPDGAIPGIDGGMPADGSTTTTDGGVGRDGGSTGPYCPGSGTIRALPEAPFAGGSRHCVVRADGHLLCWGRNLYGEAGREPIGGTGLLPVEVAGIADAVDVTLSDEFTCVLRATGEVVCFGYNNIGQLGDGRAGTSSGAARTVIGVSGATAISTGRWRSCAIGGAGRARCWGWDFRSFAGSPPVAFWATAMDETLLLAGATHVAISEFDTCVLAAGVAHCMGAPYGAAPTTPRDTTPMTGVSDFVSLHAGARHLCAVRASGALVCWGQNISGSLGDGTMLERLDGVTVPGIGPVVDVAAGWAHTCALTEDGTVWCWGGDSNGQLGNGPGSTDSLVPVQVTRGGAPFTGVTEISGFYGGTCARSDAGELLCWGQVDFGTGAPSPFPHEPACITLPP